MVVEDLVVATAEALAEADATKQIGPQCLGERRAREVTGKGGKAKRGARKQVYNPRNLLSHAVLVGCFNASTARRDVYIRGGGRGEIMWVGRAFSMRMSAYYLVCFFLPFICDESCPASFEIVVFLLLFLFVL